MNSITRVAILLICIIAVFAWRADAAVDPTLTLAPTNYTNFESPQINPLQLSPEGPSLFAANTADHRVSVFSLGNPSAPTLIAEIPVGIEPVSVWPGSSNEGG